MWPAAIGRHVNLTQFCSAGGVYLSNDRSLRYADIQPLRYIAKRVKAGRGPDSHSFSSWSGTLQLHLIYLTQQRNRTCFRWSTSWNSWRYNFCCKSSREYGIDQIEVLSTRYQVFLASMNFSAHKTGDTCTVNCLFNHSNLSLHLCKEYLTAVKWKTTFTPEKVLNVLMYGLFCFDQIQYVGELIKWS